MWLEMTSVLAKAGSLDRYAAMVSELELKPAVLKKSLKVFGPWQLFL